VLRLSFINPSAVLCFVFFEGTTVVAVLLAFADQMTFWAVLVLPTTVAVVVKFNDVVAGLLIRMVPATRAIGRAQIPALPAASTGPDSAPETLPLTDVGAPGAPRSTSATTRQSAARRYR
jgi:hypothetical protein